MAVAHLLRGYDGICDSGFDYLIIAMHGAVDSCSGIWPSSPELDKFEFGLFVH